MSCASFPVNHPVLPPAHAPFAAFPAPAKAPTGPPAAPPATVGATAPTNRPPAAKAFGTLGFVANSAAALASPGTAAAAPFTANAPASLSDGAGVHVFALGTDAAFAEGMAPSAALISASVKSSGKTFNFPSKIALLGTTRQPCAVSRQARVPRQQALVRACSNCLLVA